MNTKEVYFYRWCKTCKHEALGENEDPCNECLGQGYNEDTHRPIHWKEDNEKTGSTV